MFEQILERSADIALLVEVAAGEALEGRVVLLDRRVGRFEVERGHEGFSVTKDSAGGLFSVRDLGADAI